jgi:hypothetical protein
MVPISYPILPPPLSERGTRLCEAGWWLTWQRAHRLLYYPRRCQRGARGSARQGGGSPGSVRTVSSQRRTRSTTASAVCACMRHAPSTRTTSQCTPYQSGFPWKLVRTGVFGSAGVPTRPAGYTGGVSRASGTPLRQLHSLPHCSNDANRVPWYAPTLLRHCCVSCAMPRRSPAIQFVRDFQSISYPLVSKVRSL